MNLAFIESILLMVLRGAWPLLAGVAMTDEEAGMLQKGVAGLVALGWVCYQGYQRWQGKREADDSRGVRRGR